MNKIKAIGILALICPFIGAVSAQSTLPLSNVQSPDYISTVKPVFTPSQIAKSGNLSQALASVKLAVAKFNEASRNSAIGIEVQLTDVMISAEPDASIEDNFGQDIRRWAFLQPFWAQYLAEGSDSLLFTTTKGGGGYAISVTASSKPDAHGLSFMPQVESATIFRHEFGHRMDLLHRHGFRKVVSGQNFYTIMNGNALPYFSGLDVSYQGVVLGDGVDDSKPVIMENRELMASAKRLNLWEIPGNKIYLNKKSRMAITPVAGSFTQGSILEQRPFLASRNDQRWYSASNYGRNAVLVRGNGLFVSTPNNNTFTRPRLEGNYYAGEARIQMTEQEDGYFRISPKNSNKCYSNLNAGVGSPGAKITLYPWLGEVSQRWNVIHTGTNE